MAKSEKKKCLYALLLILWMGVIFAFSSQPSEASGKLSGGVCYRLVNGANQMLQMEWNSEQMEAYALRLGYPVRKAAHMSEYAILALLACKNLLVWEVMSQKRSYVPAFVFTILYAMTDEYHQTFVAGRSGNLTDVCIDGLGACLGLLCFALVARRYNGRKRKRGRGN